MATVYQASIESMTILHFPAQRIYSTSKRQSLRNLKMLVREFGPQFGIYEARVMATDSSGYLKIEVARADHDCRG